MRNLQEQVEKALCSQKFRLLFGTTPQFPSKIIWPLGVFQKLIRVFHSTQFSTLSLMQCCKCMLKHLNQLIVTTLSNVKITSKGKSLITNKSWKFPLFPDRTNYLPGSKNLKHYCLVIDFNNFGGIEPNECSTKHKFNPSFVLFFSILAKYLPCFGQNIALLGQYSFNNGLRTSV